MKPDLLIASMALLLVLPGCEKNAATPKTRSAERERGDLVANQPQPQAEAERQPAPSDVQGSPAGEGVPARQAAPVASASYTAALAMIDEAEREAALAKELKALAPGEAADLALATLPADAMRQRLLNTLLTEWAVAQPSATASWLSKAGDFPEKNPAIRTTADLWQRMDFDGMIRWTAGLPEGDARNAALAPIAAHIRTQPAERRQLALDAVRDPGLRADLEKMLQPARD